MLQHNIHTAICSCQMSLVVTGRHSGDMLRWSTGPSGVPAQDLPSSLLAPLMRLQKSFVLSDPRLPDCPIVHASTAFLLMTGYPRSVNPVVPFGAAYNWNTSACQPHSAMPYYSVKMTVHVCPSQTAFCIQRECATKFCEPLSVCSRIWVKKKFCCRHHTGTMQLEMQLGIATCMRRHCHSPSCACCGADAAVMCAGTQWWGATADSCKGLKQTGLRCSACTMLSLLTLRNQSLSDCSTTE